MLRREVTRRHGRLAAGLLLGVSGLTLGAVALPMVVTPAQAACDATEPATGQTVTCDTNPDNPETDGIVAPGSTGVTVELQAGAGLEVTGSPAIELGGGAVIEMMTGSTITTFGNSATGILIQDAGAATATLSATDSVLQTNGADSTLVDVDLGAASSVSVAGENTSFATIGDGSDVLSLSSGPDSDMLVSLQGSTLTSQGANATLLETSLGAGSAGDLVVLGSTFQTQGAGAGGIIHRTLGSGASGSDIFFIADTTIATAGDDAPAFVVESGGGTSVRTVTIDQSDFSTLGQNSVGVSVGGLGAGSAMEITATDMTISTEGDVSAGLDVGGVGASSALSVFVDDFDIATQGDDSTALNIGSLGGSSVKSVSLTASGGVGSLSTQGDNSAGLLVGGVTGEDSVFVFDMDSVSVETVGADSAGVVIGTPALELDNSSLSYSLNGTTVDTEGERSTGLTLHGLGDGVDNSDGSFVVTETSITTLGDDATGVLLDVFGANATSSTYTLVMDNISVATSGERSTGLVIGDGSGSGTGIVDASMSVSVANLDIATLGDDAVGLIVEPFGSVGAEETTLSVRMDAISVETAGENAHGIVLGEGLGTNPDASSNLVTLELTDLAALTEGENAHALVISANSALTLDLSSGAIVGGANSGPIAANGLMVTGTIDSFDGFEANGAGGRAVMNHGILFGTFTIGDGVRGNVANNGLIESATGAAGVAVQFDTDTDIDDIFELHTEGVVIGRVLAGEGDEDAFILGGEGAGSFDVSELDADGNDDGEQYQGFEVFTKEDSSSWELAGVNDEISLFSITGGSLLVNGTLANADIQILGGLLGGDGTVGSFTAMAGAAVAPGNSIGVLNVAGTATFNAGSFYDVEVIAAGASDLILAGDAVIDPGAVVRVAAAPGGHATTTTYTILTTIDDPLSGAFDPVPVVDLAFLDGSLSYDPNNVYLTLTRNTTAFAELALTPNQFATGTALDVMDLDGADLPYSELLSLTADEVPNALDQLSGEAHASITGALIEQSEIPRQAVLDRVQQAFDALESAGALGYADGAVPTQDPGYVIWGHGVGDTGRRESDGNAARTAASAAALLIGADTLVAGDLRLGLFAGAGQTRIAARNTDASSTDLTIGGYGGAELGVVRVSFGAAYTHHQVATSRTIALPGVDDTVTASYAAGTAQVFGEVAGQFDAGAVTLSPFAKLALVAHRHGGFSETGGPGALDVAASSNIAAFTTLGLRGEHSFALDDGMLVRAEGSLGWRHAFADMPTSTNTFAGGPGFTVAAAPIASDAVVIGTKLSLDPSDSLKASLGYEGEFGSGFTSHAARLTVGGSF